jgi:hypothetical protein
MGQRIGRVNPCVCRASVNAFASAKQPARASTLSLSPKTLNLQHIFPLQIRVTDRTTQADAQAPAAFAIRPPGAEPVIKVVS